MSQRGRFSLTHTCLMLSPIGIIVETEGIVNIPACGLSSDLSALLTAAGRIYKIVVIFLQLFYFAQKEF